MIEQPLSVICLMGPTASGKTSLAIQLHERFPLDIISVDSAMVYRGVDIGTAKPSAELLNRVPHRLINIADPVDAYSAAQFRTDALSEIHTSFLKNRVPLLVGGTMLYFRLLQQGIAPMPSADSAIRAELTEEGNRVGWEVLHKRLSSVDSVAARTIHPNDKQRIQRALEVYALTGKNITTWQQEETVIQQPFLFHYLIITPSDRQLLHQRISERFTHMLQEGLVDEVRGFYERGDLTENTPAMRSVGYRQVWDHLKGLNTFAEMREKGIIATRQLAKRQLTWLRHWPDAVWFNSESDDLLDQVTKHLLTHSCFNSLS